MCSTNIEVGRKRRKDNFFFYHWIEKEEEVNVYTMSISIEKKRERKCYESSSEPTSISQSYKHTHHIDD
jgi:hypothetical protein